MTNATANQERAAKGAALLDEKMPGWESRVDENKLDKRSVLVQLYGPFRDGRAISSLLSNHHKGDVIKGWTLAADFGFAATHHSRRRSLDAAWKTEVEKRK